MSTPTATQTLGELLTQGQRKLQDPSAPDRAAPGRHVPPGTAAFRSGSARLDAELLLAHLLHLTRGQLLARTDDVDPGVGGAFFDLIARRAAGAPVAYLLGTHEFWSLTLRVTPDVLVPRPETELVVERALALVAAQDATVADLGCGSGAIALALASERPRWRVLATDVSRAALDIARDNARTLNLPQVQFAQGSWCDALPAPATRAAATDGPDAPGAAAFDLIASNPPYLAADDAALADSVLQHEPRGALVSGPDGLEAYRAIVAAAPQHLRRGAWLVLEHGATQAAAIAALLVAAGFTHVRCHPDLAGLDRVTEARRPLNPSSI